MLFYVMQVFVVIRLSSWAQWFLLVVLQLVKGIHQCDKCIQSSEIVSNETQICGQKVLVRLKPNVFSSGILSWVMVISLRILSFRHVRYFKVGLAPQQGFWVLYPVASYFCFWSFSRNKIHVLVFNWRLASGALMKNDSQPLMKYEWTPTVTAIRCQLALNWINYC